MKTDMTASYLGLELANPLIASASPLTGALDSLHEIADAGAGAVVLPSLFEEQIEEEAMMLHLGLEYGAGAQPEAIEGYFPELDDYNTGPGEYLDLITAARSELKVPIIGSLNGVSAGGWTSYAQRIEEAGAHALELNVYLVAADTNMSGQEVEAQYLRLVEEVRSSIDIPLAVKIGPYFSSPGNMARRLVEVGADGLVLFNRFYQPDIDLEELTVSPNLQLSNSAESRLALRWIAILRPELAVSLAATTGVHTPEDALKLLLAGADAIMMTSALLRHGPYHLAEVLSGMTEWLSDREYESVQQARGSLSHASVPDPTGYERANYMRTLTSFAPAE